MKAGLLKYKIEIWAPTITTTDYGTHKEIYSKSYTTRANVFFNSGTRTTENDEIVYPKTRSFIVRHYVPVTDPMRVKFEDKFYRIVSINKNKYYNDTEIIAELVNE
jgi:head-tail adaptor